jgi:hypothetical protein
MVKVRGVAFAGAPGRDRVVGGATSPALEAAEVVGGAPGPVDGAEASWVGAVRIALAGIAVATIGATAARVSKVSMRAPLAPDWVT